MNRRYLVLHLPQLATDRLRQKEPDLADQPIATWTMQGNRRLLAGVDAPGTGLYVGQPLADAQAMEPRLVLRDADPEGDAAFLERLALWTLRFTPIAAVDSPDGLVLDVTGCTALFGGESAMLEQVADSLVRGGITARMAMAGITDVAGALARAGRDKLIVPPGGEAAVAAGLPLAALRLPVESQSGLHRLGLHRVSDLLKQPRGPLVRRFGRTLMDTLDALTGERPCSLTPIRPQPDFIENVNLLEPITTRPAIDTAVDALLERLCRQLDAAARGARTLTLRAFRVDRDVQEISVGTGLPTRTPHHLQRLFAHELERLEPDLGFERMTLEARVTNAMEAGQKTMVTTGTDTTDRDEALGQLIDRLSQRLPVWRLAPAESHWPERSCVRVGPFDDTAGRPPPSPLPAPVRLLKRPIPLMVLAEIPEGPPLRLRLDGTVHDIARADGPERIEPEWWHDAERRTGRDYYRVQLASGARLWVARIAAMRPDRPPRWFLHGYFA